MADTRHLVSLFEQCTLNDVPDQHTLTIEYPVRGLLPKDITLSLRPPANLKDREAPPHDQRRMGVFQSACHIQIPIRKPPNVPISDIRISQYDAFESLSWAPGKSHLEAVTFYDSELDEGFIRLSLRTLFKDEAEELRYDVEISPTHWQQLVEEGALWVTGLDELMNRRTHRAYYHVRNRLVRDYGWDDATAEENRWCERWGSDRLRQLERESTTMEDINQTMEMMEL